MNLFCFTLEGSTESIYEPAYSQTFKEVLPKHQCSPALRRRKPEWGGSDPSINSGRTPSSTKLKKNNRRSCLPTSPLDIETFDKETSHSCWMSSSDKKDLSHQMKTQDSAPCQSGVLTRDDRLKRLNRTRTDQGSETEADSAEWIHPAGRGKKLQNRVQTKKGHDGLTDVLSSGNPVLTCIGLGRRTEKKSSKAAPSAEQLQRQQATDVHEGERVWSPRLGNDLWSPFVCPPSRHTCHQPRHQLLVCGGTLSLPWTREWDRFESLIQELDSKQSELSPPQTTTSVADLPPPQNPSSRFGRFDAFRQHSPLTTPQNTGGPLNDDPTRPRLQWRERTLVKASPEKMPTATTNGSTQKDEAEKGDAGGGGPFTKGHRRSANSLESLSSVNSGQSSSSGVTSGSDCSSNRDSLRMEDSLLCTGQFCGRARVHTDFVPSPYDTESLKLKVGDVIDIVSKPPMGIWTGVLHGRMGNFKFIYVDVLTEESPDAHVGTQPHRVRQKSTVQEVLKRLSLEEYSSSLQLNGYQTVDDLMLLREHHLMRLNVTDPEHRHRLLAAVDSLQQLRADSRLENEANQEAETPSKNLKADKNSHPRDSGCHMPSDSSDSSAEDADLHFLSECSPPAEAPAS